MSGEGEGAGIGDGQEYRRCGLDAYSRHGHQDLGKREVIEELFDFFGDDRSLVFVFFSLCCDAGDDQLDGFGADDGDALLVQCRKDRLDQVQRILPAVVSGPAQHIGPPAARSPMGPEYLMNSSRTRDRVSTVPGKTRSRAGKICRI